MESHKGMKRKTIKKILVAKIDDWLSTIDDDDLRQRMKKNIVVTGGSIASMLLGEKINDFDIYFKNIETTEAVAKYYVDRFKRQMDMPHFEMSVIRKNETNIKGQTEELVKVHITSSGVAQDDTFVSETFGDEIPDDLNRIVNKLSEEPSADKPRYRPVFLSENAITLSDDIQIVIRFYGEPDQIHDNYDFVHAMNYYDYHRDELVLNPEALEALLSKTLVYRGSLYPIASIFRSKKFIERGWKISAGQLLKIMWQISEIDLSNPDILRQQLTGVDQAYMYQLISALEGINAEDINSCYVAEVIDRIFG